MKVKYTVLENACPYCNGNALLKDSKIIYGRSYGNIWICEKYPECDSYCGVHKETNEPLGRLANKELREWKSKAHETFDPLWKRKMEKGLDKRTSRNAAYEWLAKEMNLSREECHIGLFDVDQCKEVIKICKAWN